jgi:hypothetical protein
MAFNLHDYKYMDYSMVSQTVVEIPVLARQVLIKGSKYKKG